MVPYYSFYSPRPGLRHKKQHYSPSIFRILKRVSVAGTNRRVAGLAVLRSNNDSCFRSPVTAGLPTGRQVPGQCSLPVWRLAWEIKSHQIIYTNLWGNQNYLCPCFLRFLRYPFSSLLLRTMFVPCSLVPLGPTKRYRTGYEPVTYKAPCIPGTRLYRMAFNPVQMGTIKSR